MRANADSDSKPSAEPTASASSPPASYRSAPAKIVKDLDKPLDLLGLLQSRGEQPVPNGQPAAPPGVPEPPVPARASAAAQVRANGGAEAEAAAEAYYTPQGATPRGSAAPSREPTPSSEPTPTPELEGRAQAERRVFAAVAAIAMGAGGTNHAAPAHGRLVHQFRAARAQDRAHKDALFFRMWDMASGLAHGEQKHAELKLLADEWRGLGA